MEIEPRAQSAGIRRDRLKLAQEQVGDFCLGLFNTYQDLMSSHLLCLRSPLRPGPLSPPADDVEQALGQEDASLLGPTAFFAFVLLQRIQATPAAPRLPASQVAQLLHRHPCEGGQGVAATLALAHSRGLLLCEGSAHDPSYRVSATLVQILSDSRARHWADQAAAAPAEELVGAPALDAADDLQRQIKRAYRAHKMGQFDYVLEVSALALKALRARERAGAQRVVDQKVLLLSLRARALLQHGQLNASDACLSAALKCLALSSTRYPIDCPTAVPARPVSEPVREAAAVAPG